MKTTYAASWKASVQPRKQRKFRLNAPLHIRASFMGAHLSKELRQTLGARSAVVREGDTVKVVRGQHKGKTGKVRTVLRVRQKLVIEGVEVSKRDGSKMPVPVNPSNVIIIDVVQSDKKRTKRSKRK